ncbi:MAG: hypothetical protein VX727_04485 [Planctomycetota bacterium]|nr:hypothetical protein [Planctomycetota bacterium]
MHNRVTTVVLSIVAFAATTGLVIAAGGERPGSNRTVEQGSNVDKGTARPLPGAIGTPWVGVDSNEPKPNMALKPRTIQPKPDRIDRPGNASGSRLVVKFVDEARLRVLPDSSVMSLTGMDVEEINDLLITHGVILEASSNVPQERMQAVINRAELRSGNAQPDVAGIYYVTGFIRDVDNAADALLRSDLVEWAFFQSTDSYTANMVSLAEAPAATPRVAPPIASTPVAIAAEARLSDLSRQPIMEPLQRGEATFACCFYRLDATTLTWSLDVCNDTTQAECTAFQDAATITQFTPGRTCLFPGDPGNPGPCDPLDIPAACCFPDGSCINQFQVLCQDAGGTYDPTGTGLSCDNPAVDCPVTEFPPIEVGVCCLTSDEDRFFDTLGGALGVGGAAGPDNPVLVKYCEIVQSQGFDPDGEDFVTASDVCGDLGGTYLGSVDAPESFTCSDCDYYGGCCAEGDCENSDDCDDGVDLFSSLVTINGNVPNSVWYPTQGAPVGGYAVDQTAPGVGDPVYGLGWFAGSYLLNVGPLPTLADSQFDPATFTTPLKWADNVVYNQDVLSGYFTGFQGLPDGAGGFNQIPTPADMPDPTGTVPGTGTLARNAQYDPLNPADGGILGFVAWGLSAGNVGPAIARQGGPLDYGAYSYCTNWCMGAGNGTDSCVNDGDPATPAMASNFIPRHRCAGQTPYFMGLGAWFVDPLAGDTPIPFGITPDPGCTEFLGLNDPNGWLNPDAYEPGQTVADAFENPMEQGACSTGVQADLLHGSCFWNRNLFPTYIDAYAETLFGPGPTPWNASPNCFNGPYCQDPSLCEQICAELPSCCVGDDFVQGFADWDAECAAAANLLGGGPFPLGWYPDGLAAIGLPTPYPNGCGNYLLANNQCISTGVDLIPYDGWQPDGSGFGGANGRQPGCSDLECCARVFAAGQALDPPVDCSGNWTPECVALAYEECYFDVPVTDDTPDFTPLQFHLLGNETRTLGRRGISTVAAESVPEEYRSLIPAPFFVKASPDSTGSIQSDIGLLIPPFIPTGTNGFQDFGGRPNGYTQSRWSGSGLQLEQRVPFSPSTGLYSWGQFLSGITRGLHPAGDNVNGTKGLGVRVAVLDNAAWVQEWTDFQGNVQGAIHEDLRNVRLEGRDTPHPPVRMLFDPIATRPQRGTGVLGIIAAEENGFGVTGIAPECEPYFFPTIDVDLGFREVAAWVNAIDSLSYGDVILATYLPSYYQGGGQGDGGGGAQGGCADSCLLNDPQSSTMMQIASDAGIVVIVPAGDFACDIDATLEGEQGDVIMVAGAMPNGNAQRWWTSNYTTTNTGAAYGGTGISCSSWGTVVTTGGNANLTKVALNIPGPGDDTQVLTTEQKRRSYTNDFGNNVIDGGSIAASAVVAGSVACVQGLSLQRFGAMQPPSVMQRMPHDWGTPRIDRSNTPGGPGEFFNSANSTAQIPWGFDLNKDGEGWFSQRLIQPNEMGVALVTDSDYALDTAGFITDVKLLRGDPMGGTISSLRAVDENYYSALTRPTATGFYNPPFFVPGPPYYSSVGQYVDMMVEMTVPQVTPIGNRIDADLTILPPPGVVSLIEMYSWNWKINTWQFMGIQVSTGDETEAEPLEFTNYQGSADEIRSPQGLIYMRAVVRAISLNGGPVGGPSPGSLVRFDQLDITFVPGSGGGGPPG